MTFTMWAKDCDEGRKAWDDYVTTVQHMDAEEVLKEFFTYLDYREIKGQEDREIRPIHISCVRAMMHEPLAVVLKRMREVAFYGKV